jgi:hypothetical protein
MQADQLQSTTVTVALKVYLNDHVTPATGKTVAITISVNKGAFANPSAGATNATEIGNGWYYWTSSTTDTGTLGPLIVLGTSAGCDNADQAYHITKATNRGMTGIPDAAANTSGGLPILSVSGTTLAYTISTLTTYAGNTPQTGDSFARLGAPAGASVSADVASVKLSVGSVTGSVGGIAGVAFPTRFSALAIDTNGFVTFNNASIATATTVTNPVTISLTETLNAARALDAIADTSLTINDALQCAVASIAAQVDASSGSACIFKTASTGTTLRTKALTLISAPTTVPDKAV